MQNSIDPLYPRKLPQQKTKLVPRKKVSQETTPSDKVSLGSALKTPRPGSDMAQMVDDLKANGVSIEAKEQKPQLKTPRPGSDMAQMLEDIHSPSGQQIMMASANGATLTVFEKELPPEPKAVKPAAAEKTEKAEEEKESVATAQTAQDLNDVADGVMQNLTPAQEISGAVSEAMATGGGATSEASSQTLEALLAAQVSEQAVKGNPLETAAEPIAKAAPELNQGMETGMIVAAGASMLLAPFLLVGGVKRFAAGRSQRKAAEVINKVAGRAKASTKSPEIEAAAEAALERAKEVKAEGTDNVLKGTGTVLMGGRSLLAAATTSSLITGTQLVAPLVSKVLLAGTGVAAGGIDVVLGARDIARGKKLKGALEIGFGVAVGAAALGGGLPAVIATGGFLLGKLGLGIYERRQAKKAAEAQQKAAQPQTS